MFYNVENLFDTLNDSTKNDNEFLPNSAKKWTNSKWYKKTQKIAQVITAANFPDIVGFCEVENKTVLKRLVNSTLLWKERYEVLHFESKDQRGIDVALIYKPKRLNLLSLKPIFINLKGKRKTRDILSITLANEKDTFALFINHWPSRYGGKRKSDPKRLIAAHTLKKHMDSVITNYPRRKTIAFGDFNDEQKDSSLSLLKNYTFASFEFQGTIKYKGRWQTFDQFILSKNIVQTSKILNFEFLLEPDYKYKGVKPYRTFIGPRYKNGFSDHLPILLKI
jgi:predicted extracellular nuclease